MRILQVSSEHPPQQIFGLGRYVCDLSRELARQRHQIHVLTNSIGGPDQDIQDRDVWLHRVDFPPPPKPAGPVAPVLAFNLHLQQRANALGKVGLGDPEVVVSHDWLTALAGHRLARRWKIPHVWTVHDTVHGKCFGKVESDGDRMIFELERWAAQEADMVLVNSRAIQDEVTGIYGGRSSKIRLLHCAIDPELYFSSQESSRVTQFRSVFASPEELLITYAGRLDMEKGLDTLINAFAILHQEFPRTKLAIAGRGALQETIEGHIKQLGLENSIALYGYLRGEVLKHFYIVSDIHVCPSHYEPFGIVALEAMAAGTPVVVSATGGLTDIINTPAVGHVFPPGDSKALAGVLLELAQNPRLRKRVAKAGARHVRERFVWSGMAKKAVEHYRAACN